MVYIFNEKNNDLINLELDTDIKIVKSLDIFLNKFKINEDRLIVIGKSLHKITKDLTQKKGLVVVQYFSDIDWIETIKTNGANVLILDFVLHSKEVIEWAANKWIKNPQYEKDGFHDQYVIALKSWHR